MIKLDPSPRSALTVHTELVSIAGISMHRVPFARVLGGPYHPGDVIRVGGNAVLVLRAYALDSNGAEALACDGQSISLGDGATCICLAPR